MYRLIGVSRSAVTLVLSHVICVLAIAPRPLAAQQCGWDSREIRNGEPLVFSTLLSRRSSSSVSTDALEQFHEWVTDCDATAARIATREMGISANRHRSNNLINAVYGIMLARGPEVQVEGAAGYLFRAVVPNSNAEKEATRRLAAVAERTAWPEVAAELTALALATRNGTALREASRILKQLAPGDPTLWIQLAEVEIVNANYDAARFAAGAAHAAGSPGALRTLGVVNLLSPDSAAAGRDYYIAGMMAADGLTLQKYYDDLVPLLTAAELAAWDSLDAPEQPAWLHRAWEWRASISTLPLEERLQTHFVRLEYAFQAYRRQSFRPATYASVWLDGRLPPLPLDDRGIVFVRHGAPDDMVRFLAPKSLDRWSGMTGPAVNRTAWFYRSLAGGRAILEFDKSAYRPDYFLGDPSRRCELAADDDSYEARLREWNRAFKQKSYGCTYATVAGDTGRKHWSAIELAAVTADAILQTESAEPELSRPIDLLVNAYALRAGFNTELTTFVWAEAESIVPMSGAGAATYSLPLFIALEKAASHSVVRFDTTLALRRNARFGARDAIMIAHTFLPSFTGEVAVRVALQNDADSLQGQIALMKKSVREYRKGFSVSDLVIAEPRDGSWYRGDTGLAPVPAHVIAEGDPFRLFYELYGLAAGEPIEVEVLIVPEGTSGLIDALRELISQRHAQSLSFDDTAESDSDGVVRRWHDVQAALRHGSYIVVVRLTRSSGETAESTTTLEVL